MKFKCCSKNENKDIREAVSTVYTRAVEQSGPKSSGCCGSAKAEPEQKGLLAKLAGYTGEELASLPAEAVEDSFGCGNPVSMAGLREGDVVLDLGSGAGIDLFLAAKKVGNKGRVIGVDMTDKLIERARLSIAAGNYTNIEVRKGIIEELPVESSSVDWVISNCVINLSPEKEKVFKEIARVLKPGGRMLVSDMIVDDMPEEVSSRVDLYSSCVSGAISEDKYLTGLRSAGMSEVEVKARLVYDKEQLMSIMDSPVIPAEIRDNPVLAKKLVLAIVGKVWSAKIFARKPLQK